MTNSAAAIKEAASVSPGYDPKIEAMRAGYERLAEEISHMIELQGEPTDLLDLNTFGADTSNTSLMDGVIAHLHALWENMNWHDLSTLRKFYPEMRLHIAQLALDRDRYHENVLAKTAQRIQRIVAAAEESD